MLKLVDNPPIGDSLGSSMSGFEPQHFIAKSILLDVHDKQQMYGMGHKIKIRMKDTNNSQQTASL